MAEAMGVSRGEIRAAGRGRMPGGGLHGGVGGGIVRRNPGDRLVAIAGQQAERRVRRQRGTRRIRHSVSKINFMVKLLRACVWMPWRK